MMSFTFTVGTRAFHRLPAVYIFSTLGLVAPGFGLGGSALVLQPYQPRTHTQTQTRTRTLTRT